MSIPVCFRGDRIAIMDNGELTIHAGPAGGSDYATLCGLAGDDPTIGLQEVPYPGKKRITCAQCFWMWRKAKGYEAGDFIESLTRPFK